MFATHINRKISRSNPRRLVRDLFIPNANELVADKSGRHILITNNAEAAK